MQVTHEDGKTYIANLEEIAESVGLDTADLLTFIACMCECEMDYPDSIYGEHSEDTLNAVIDEYRDTFIKCPHCTSMNTTLQISRSRPVYRITCDDCGKKKIRTISLQYSRFVAWIRRNYGDDEE